MSMGSSRKVSLKIKSRPPISENVFAQSTRRNVFDRLGPSTSSIEKPKISIRSPKTGVRSHGLESDVKVDSGPVIESERTSIKTRYPASLPAPDDTTVAPRHSSSVSSKLEYVDSMDYEELDYSDDLPDEISLSEKNSTPFTHHPSDHLVEKLPFHSASSSVVFKKGPPTPRSEREGISMKQHDVHRSKHGPKTSSHTSTLSGEGRDSEGTKDFSSSQTDRVYKSMIVEPGEHQKNVYKERGNVKDKHSSLSSEQSQSHGQRPKSDKRTPHKYPSCDVVHYQKRFNHSSEDAISNRNHGRYRGSDNGTEKSVYHSRSRPSDHRDRPSDRCWDQEMTSRSGAPVFHDPRTPVEPNSKKRKSDVHSKESSGGVSKRARDEPHDQTDTPRGHSRFVDGSSQQWKHDPRPSTVDSTSRTMPVSLKKGSSDPRRASRHTKVSTTSLIRPTISDSRTPNTKKTLSPLPSLSQPSPPVVAQSKDVAKCTPAGTHDGYKRTAGTPPSDHPAEEVTSPQLSAYVGREVAPSGRLTKQTCVSHEAQSSSLHCEKAAVDAERISLHEEEDAALSDISTLSLPSDNENAEVDHLSLEETANIVQDKYIPPRDASIPDCLNPPRSPQDTNIPLEVVSGGGLNTSGDPSSNIPSAVRRIAGVPMVDLVTVPEDPPLAMSVEHCGNRLPDLADAVGAAALVEKAGIPESSSDLILLLDPESVQVEQHSPVLDSCLSPIRNANGTQQPPISPTEDETKTLPPLCKDNPMKENQGAALIQHFLMQQPEAGTTSLHTEVKPIDGSFDGTTSDHSLDHDGVPLGCKTTSAAPSEGLLVHVLEEKILAESSVQSPNKRSSLGIPSVKIPGVVSEQGKVHSVPQREELIHTKGREKLVEPSSSTSGELERRIAKETKHSIQIKDKANPGDLESSRGKDPGVLQRKEPAGRFNSKDNAKTQISVGRKPEFSSNTGEPLVPRNQKRPVNDNRKPSQGSTRGSVTGQKTSNVELSLSPAQTKETPPKGKGHASSEKGSANREQNHYKSGQYQQKQDREITKDHEKSHLPHSEHQARKTETSSRTESSQETSSGQASTHDRSKTVEDYGRKSRRRTSGKITSSALDSGVAAKRPAVDGDRSSGRKRSRDGQGSLVSTKPSHLGGRTPSDSCGSLVKTSKDGSVPGDVDTREMEKVAELDVEDVCLLERKSNTSLANIDWSEIDTVSKKLQQECIDVRKGLGSASYDARGVEPVLVSRALLSLCSIAESSTGDGTVIEAVSPPIQHAPVLIECMQRVLGTDADLVTLSSQASALSLSADVALRRRLAQMDFQEGSSIPIDNYGQLCPSVDVNTFYSNIEVSERRTRVTL